MYPSEDVTEFSTHIKLLSLLGLIIGLLCMKHMLLKTSLDSAHIQHRHVVARDLNRLLPRELHQRVTSLITVIITINYVFKPSCVFRSVTVND